MTKVYRHKTIRTYGIGKFRFKNFKMTLSDAEGEEFEALVQALPAMKRNHIVVVNEEAAAAAERPLGPSTIRGADNVDNMLTAKDRERLLLLKQEEMASATTQIPGTSPIGGTNSQQAEDPNANTQEDASQQSGDGQQPADSNQQQKPSAAFANLLKNK